MLDPGAVTGAGDRPETVRMIRDLETGVSVFGPGLAAALEAIFGTVAQIGAALG